MSAVAPARVRVISVGGVRVRVSVRGAGRPLLLVMGIGASLDMWDRSRRSSCRAATS